MTDTSASADDAEGDDGAAPADRAPADPATADDPELDALRAEVEEKYDFDNFGPADMREMTGEEWEAAFDPDSWITGVDLLDRVEKDLQNRIASREVFAVLDRRRDPPSVVAYSDEGWAVVYDDGSVEGEGTVLRDVKPTVALCSMESYDVAEPPEAYELPTPDEVEGGTGEFGNLMMQLVAGSQVLVGLGIGVVWLFTDLFPSPPGGRANVFIPVAAAFFVLIGVFLFAVVANARLSDRFRAEEYRDRLRAAGITDDGGEQFAAFEQVVSEALADARADADSGAEAGSENPDGPGGADAENGR
ncbi:DUF7319 domain-containing protein [Halobaculum sp. P14]|uniref:DUF7319 domain-containing protein n=1 Tax=Halobaculum sp. P14 TaxID=3421638 RepID=UPI003EC082A4